MMPQFLSDLLTVMRNNASTIGLVLAIIFFAIQLFFFIKTLCQLCGLKKFFPSEPKYHIKEVNGRFRIEDINEKEFPRLYRLIEELNKYIKNTRGTTDFAIIQNKTERVLNTLIEDATSKVSFPTYFGLMGTFAGVFLGLLLFNSGINLEDTNLPITSLINGVLVSMSTSFIGLLLTTINNAISSSALKEVDNRKNDFYDFLQNELMPTLDTSMVVALNRLHDTVNLMQPSFTAVIDQFKSAFQTSTQAFGQDFRNSVSELRASVEVMRSGMDSINENIRGQQELLQTIQSRHFIETLSAFVDTANYFNRVVGDLNEVSGYVRQISSSTESLVQAQNSYNENLSVPTQLFNEINSLLNRVKRFEQSMNEIGEKINKNHIWGMEFANTLKLHTDKIAQNSRQIEVYLDSSSTKIDRIFKGQEAKMQTLSERYTRALQSFYDNIESLLTRQEADLRTRHDEFARKLDEAFNFDDVHDEFESLLKLNEISSELTQLRAQFETIFKKDDVQNQLINIRKLQDIVATLDTIKASIDKHYKNINVGQNNAKNTKDTGTSIQQQGQRPANISDGSNPYVKEAKRVVADTSKGTPVSPNEHNDQNTGNNRGTFIDTNKPKNENGDNRGTTIDEDVPIWKRMFPWLK